MIGTDYLALAPFIAVTVTTLVVMLVMSFKRNHRLTVALTVVGLVISLVLLIPALESYPRMVTPLVYLDGSAAFLIGLFLLISIVITLISYPYLAESGDQVEEYYLLVCTATLGAMTLASAQHFATVLLGLEIMSISFYTLIAYPDEGHPPLEAGLKYLILSGVASTTMLFGMALIYNATGSLTFTADTLQTAATGLREGMWLSAGFALFFIAMAFKLSLVPFHMWTPDVYQGAPLPVTGFLATLSKAAVFGVLLRFAVSSEVFDSPLLSGIVAAIAMLSMVLGNLLALMQENVKRMLAYSSIAHLGYLLIGLLAVSALKDDFMAVETCLVFLAAYVAMTLTAFTVLGLLKPAAGSIDAGEAEQLTDLSGLFWRRPLLAAALTIAFLSLAGIPLTAGFIAKFYLFAAGVEGALWSLIWAMIVGSAIAIFYYLRVIFTMTQPLSVDDSSATQAPGLLGSAVATLLALSVILMGTYPTPVIELVRNLVAQFG